MSHNLTQLIMATKCISIGKVGDKACIAAAFG